eukprot:TRINITY_DN8335_c0_g1_i4.p1 TRINITY_DN8335_c0_g1~~TRINITY_DN8335_c0_g1_i4.p1  ORF type:complete len:103 (+),score=16.66 TRINITY_DN8335_c0_g1_i4:130-438(+)
MSQINPSDQHSDNTAQHSDNNTGQQKDNNTELTDGIKANTEVTPDGTKVNGVPGANEKQMNGHDTAHKANGITSPKRLKKEPEIGRAVQQECRDRSRMPSSA